MIYVAMMAASTVMQAEAQDTMAEENRKSAEASYKAQTDALNLQREQITDQAQGKVSETARQEQATLAQLRVAAGESGVSGVSVERAAGEVELDADQDIVAIQSNHANAMKQTNANAAGLAAQTMSQINSVPKANWGATALQIGGKAASVYNPELGWRKSYGVSDDFLRNNSTNWRGLSVFGTSAGE